MQISRSGRIYQFVYRQLPKQEPAKSSCEFLKHYAYAVLNAIFTPILYFVDWAMSWIVGFMFAQVPRWDEETKQYELKDPKRWPKVCGVRIVPVCVLIFVVVALVVVLLLGLVGFLAYDLIQRQPGVAAIMGGLFVVALLVLNRKFFLDRNMVKELRTMLRAFRDRIFGRFCSPVQYVD